MNTRMVRWVVGACVAGLMAVSVPVAEAVDNGGAPAAAQQHVAPKRHAHKPLHKKHHVKKHAAKKHLAKKHHAKKHVVKKHRAKKHVAKKHGA